MALNISFFVSERAFDHYIATHLMDKASVEDLRKKMNYYLGKLVQDLRKK